MPSTASISGLLIPLMVPLDARGFGMGASRQPATESQVADRRTLADRIRENLRAAGTNLPG